MIVEFFLAIGIAMWPVLASNGMIARVMRGRHRKIPFPSRILQKRHETAALEIWLLGRSHNSTRVR